MELFTEEEFISSKSYNELLLKCDHCNKNFTRRKGDIQKARRLKRPHYCSPKCDREHHSLKVEVPCTNCGKVIKRNPSQLKRSKSIFCSQSCNAKWHNPTLHKKKFENCVVCDTPLTNSRSKYCSTECSGKDRTAKHIKKWKEDPSFGHTGKNLQLKSVVRNYLLEKAGHKCSKCGWAVIHPTTGRPPLEVNHIDGDALNCKEENLEVLCPNCHALTLNHRRLNKVSSRQR